MGVDYAVSQYFGFKIPDDLNEKDEKILENLIYNWLVIKPEYQEIILISESEVEIVHDRLSHFIKLRLGDKVYPKTYCKVIETKKETDFSNKLMNEFQKLSFQPKYEYYEYARIC